MLCSSVRGAFGDLADADADLVEFGGGLRFCLLFFTYTICTHNIHGYSYPYMLLVMHARTDS
jgi:hypothetical protein